MKEQNSARPQREGKASNANQSEYMTERPKWELSEQRKDVSGKRMQQRWEAQWQEFLKTLQSPYSACGNLQLSETTPWDDTKAFLASFEQVAEACRWPRGEWVIRLLPALSGEAEQAFQNMESTDQEDYGKVKAAILRADALRVEVQRQHFRQFCCQEVEDPRRIHCQLQELCHQWLKPDRHSKEQILELLILEQFLAILPPEMLRWVKENDPESCAEAVALAEDFLRREQEAEQWDKQVVYSEMPVNSCKAEEPPSEIGEKNADMEVNEEGKGDANYIGDGQSSETEESEVTCLEPVEVGGKGEGTPTLSEGEEDVTFNEAESEERPGKDIEETSEASNYFTESTKPQKASRGKQEATCTMCGKSFSRRAGLLAHERVHTGEKPYKCSHCGRSFRSKSTLVVHQRTHTGEKPYQCQECGKGFPVTTQLIEHERTHSGEKPYKCGECGQTFRQRSHLKNHQKIHTGVKPFKCSYCGKSFSISSDLIRHERAHTGEKPFQCPECGKRFCNSSQVITHRRVHTGEKPYKCMECGKGFTVSQQLIRHQSVHTGDKPFQCLECGKTFSGSTLLAGHLRIHTGEKPYQCSKCGKSFRLRSTLITHLKIHMEGKVEK